jgi:hypothetical protein
MSVMASKVIRSTCSVVFVAGIVGMIVSSINGNNNGWVVSFGIATAIASLILLAVAASTNTARIDVFEEADAEVLEGRIGELVGAGADETEVRRLVRDALRTARRR